MGADKLHRSERYTNSRLLSIVWHIVSANYASMGMWRDSLQKISPIGFFLVEIRGAGP